MNRPIAPPKNARSHDMIETPYVLACQIVDHYGTSGRQLDPCRGAGAFYTAMKERNQGEVAWCEVTEGVNFFQVYSGDEILFDWVCSNPPWSQFRRFLQHSMEIANHVVFLGTLTHFITRARLRDIKDHGFGMREAFLVDQPPAPWPSSGFQLAAVHLQRGWSGPMTFSGTI